MARLARPASRAYASRQGEVSYSVEVKRRVRERHSQDRASAGTARAYPAGVREIEITRTEIRSDAESLYELDFRILFESLGLTWADAH